LITARGLDLQNIRALGGGSGRRLRARPHRLRTG
jgi:hypothetical protein